MSPPMEMNNLPRRKIGAAVACLRPAPTQNEVIRLRKLQQIDSGTLVPVMSMGFTGQMRGESAILHCSFIDAYTHPSIPLESKKEEQRTHVATQIPDFL